MRTRESRFPRLTAPAGLLVLVAMIAAAPSCDQTETRPVEPPAEPPVVARDTGPLPLIRPDVEGRCFVRADDETRFFAWGFNYDHDDSGRLLEDYWHDEWPTVVEDFREMKELGANLVRIHLQTGRFLDSSDRPNERSLARLGRLVRLAGETGLHLDITGLGCYHKADVPPWYGALDEEDRWAAQALFWKSVARVCAGSDAIFCYDLMNEPILPGANEKETDWLAGEFGGKHFVQRISLDLAGRTRHEVARAWIDRLVAAIRSVDDRHMITVGVIPWAFTFPGAKPLFYAPEVGGSLDFVSIHLYPQEGEIAKALDTLPVYRVGKPLLIEETSPLWCGGAEFDRFVEGSREQVDGYLGFYWGKTIDEYARPGSGIADAIMKSWLEQFRAWTARMR